MEPEGGGFSFEVDNLIGQVLENAVMSSVLDQLLDSKFEQFVDKFTKDHCLQFTDDSEYKLGYTDIHQQ